MTLLEQHLLGRHSDITGKADASFEDYQKLADLIALAAQHIPSLKDIAQGTEKLSVAKKKEDLKEAASAGLARVRKSPRELTLADVEAAMGAWQQLQEHAGADCGSSEEWVDQLQNTKTSLAELLNDQLTEAEEVASEMCHAVTELILAISQALQPRCSGH